MLSHVWLFATPWAVIHQARLSMEYSRQEYWSGLPVPSTGSSQPRDQMWVSHIAGSFFTIGDTREAQEVAQTNKNYFNRLNFLSGTVSNWIPNFNKIRRNFGLLSHSKAQMWEFWSLSTWQSSFLDWNWQKLSMKFHVCLSVKKNECSKHNPLLQSKSSDLYWLLKLTDT